MPELERELAEIFPPCGVEEGGNVWSVDSAMKNLMGLTTSLKRFTKF